MAPKQPYKKLFEPLQIKNVRLKNRIVKPAQWLIFAESDGSIGDRIVAFYESIAKGGVGLITVEESNPEYPRGASNVPHVRLDDDRFIPGLARLAEAIHKHEVPAFVQITHAGPAHNPMVDGEQPIAPSSLEPPVEPVFAVAREMTVPEIETMVEKFAQAALRVKKAGFDGVEMHMAHYALVNAFLSRAQNKRQDEYGCHSLENRARFSVKILQRARELVGPDFLVGVRMSGKEWGHPLGTTNEEAVEFARMFEAAGADYLQVSAYGYGAFSLCAFPDLVIYPEVPPEAKEFAERIRNGALIPEAAAIRRAVSIPVSGVGRLTFEAAEQALEQGLVDMVCFGRRLMADPEAPTKLLAGKEKEIRPCLGCLECLHIMLMNQPVECRVNVFLGHEHELALVPAETVKKVMVVGAGPGGMEAARVAAERGHQVTLYDKARELGGLMPMAAFIKGALPDDLTEALGWYERQFKRLGVQVQLGTEVTPDLVSRETPDVVIVATGGTPIQPDLPVDDGAKVVTTEQLKGQAKEFVRLLGSKRMSALTKLFLPVGNHVVVVGSDLAGLEAAEFLAKRGKQVTVVDEAPQIGEGVLIHWLVRLLPWMAAKGIQTYAGVKYEVATRTGLTFTTSEGEKKTIPADTIMVVNRYDRNAGLFEALQGVAPEVYLIGDAKGRPSAYIRGAIHDGARVALAI